MRRVLVGLGLLTMGWGARALLLTGWHNVIATVVWMAGAVALHDGLLGFALVAAGLAVARLVGGGLRRPVVAALIVLGTVTATAIPVLGRFGARPDNPTLLDRNYLVGWLVVTAVVAVGAIGWTWLMGRSSRPARRARRGSRRRPSGG